MPYKILIALAAFMLVAGLLYAVTPSKYRYVSLLAVSFACICWMSGFGAVFILLTIITTYLSGIIMERIEQKHDTTGLEKQQRKQIKAKVKQQKKLVVLGYIVINLGILITLKYFNFFSTSASNFINLFGAETKPMIFRIAVPLGISYYTLQALSYVMDVFRGKYKPERNLLKMATFIAFFPQLHEGPFGRFDLLAPQLFSGKQITLDNIYNGAARILWGLFKIFMIANRASIISDAMFKDYSSYGGIAVLLGGIAFTVQLYAEFSGYIDVAAGISKIFGIELTKNFDMPFMAQNVAEFWRRWHISLGTFFRDYVFYPVSTSKWIRKLTGKMNFNMSSFVSLTASLLIVWFLTGLWHGASWKYICYGVYYFILILIFNAVNPLVDKLLEKAKISKENKIVAAARVLKTWILVLIGMIMFRAENMTAFFSMIRSLFSSGEHLTLFSVIEVQDLAAFIFSLLVVIAGAVLKMRRFNIEQKYNELAPYKRYLVCFTMFCIIMVFGAYGFDYVAPDPIYGGF